MANQFDFQPALLSDVMDTTYYREQEFKSKRLFERVREIVNQIDYKPHTGFRVLRDARCVVFLQHVQHIEDCLAPPDIVDEVFEQRGRKFYISTYMTDEEIVRTASLAVKTFESHEGNEWFRYKGDRYLNPHPEGSRDEPAKMPKGYGAIAI